MRYLEDTKEENAALQADNASLKEEMKAVKKFCLTRNTGKNYWKNINCKCEGVS